MMIKNFKQLDFVLKNAFFKIKTDIKRLEEANKATAKDLSVIRKNLLEFNSFNKRLESLEKKIAKKDSWETEEKEKRGLFSRFF